MIDLQLRVICRPYINQLPELYRLLGFNYGERVLLSIIFEIAGGVVVSINKWILPLL